jgi:ATP-dependent DNA helicase RecG
MANWQPAPPLLDRILDAARIGENDDWEFKSAKGGLPGSLWETYSAMANSAGGTIVLGARENTGGVALDGLPRDRIESLKKTLWDGLNNRGVVNRNIVASGDIKAVQPDTGWLLAIHVPHARRNERPVYRGQNPFGGTFKRRHEGDYRCSDEEVRRMFADASDTPADARILQGFGLADLDGASLTGFRNRFAATKPGHPWLVLENVKFLEKLGGWRKDRESSAEGVTLAGVLMFGKHTAIVSPGAAPNYVVDYRDFRWRRPEERWGDRLFSDGTWEANLFQFYQRCWPKLVADLKVPFTLTGAQRIDETPVHVALREALVNALIHPDYSVGGGIVIERYDERYQFGNPGTLLVSEAQLRQGGVSECRNRSLQRMFMLIGGGEQAGSGYARIQEGWKRQHWRAPRLMTQYGPDRVRLDMPMVSLIPEEAIATLRDSFGRVFERLTRGEILALATAFIEGDVTNTRMQDLVSDHPSDITKLLRGLVANGFLVHDNQRRWTRYSLPTSIVPRQDLFSLDRSQKVEAVSSPTGGDSSPLPQASSPLAGESSPLLRDSSPLAGESSPLPPKGEEWKAAAIRVAARGKVSKTEMQAVILELCRGRFLTLAELAALLNRAGPNLRNKYLTPMVRQGTLRLRYPDRPNRPNQAYSAADETP